jgi:hypothetical protein
LEFHKLGTPLNNSRSYEEYNRYHSQGHNDPLVHGIGLFRHEILCILLCAPTFSSAHRKSPLFYGIKTTILQVKEELSMDKTVLNKLKNRAVGVASAALVRVELTTEEGRLKTKFQSLGQKLYGAVQDDLLKAIKDDPSVVELIGGIEETKKKIAELEKKLAKGTSGEET